MYSALCDNVSSTEDVSVCISEIIQVLIPQNPVCVQNIVNGCNNLCKTFL